ncbi:hypothetical protein GALMADRAFT_132294 [Galerina marginata CBS 339.88]|uniref:DUF6535 domain-containing protein n=1 Tax=Galerina marginata (strain CBS 339.88) TaxID=685588 RepID=A0A067TQY3_GALM3|nr:hypothetical protein GALMADRAFT_132294 [Galerina marginata CBS 339.88]
MADRKAADGYQPFQYDDPSANLWSTFLSKSEKYDKDMAQNWKGDMDAILIFAGLFSASVTSFIIESYKTLNPDPNNATVTLLAQISQQLALMANGTSSSADALSFPAFTQPSFTPSLSSLFCNALWFLSLGFSLTCALSATLVEQWTRQYIQATNSKPAPQDRARLSAYLYQGIKTYKMATIVETIPMLLHISLFLFFAGLVAFLIPINSTLEYLILVMLAVCCILYFLVSVLPIFQLSCPYWTPLSSVFWSVLRRLHLLHRRDLDGNKVPIVSRMSNARELDAMEITPERDQRDLKAMCWTLNALREDNEFEPFVEVIPSVVSGFDYSAKWLMDALMIHDDISIKLGYRVPRLLASCTNGLLDPAIAHKRAVTCLKSIWSLTMLSMPKPSSPQYSLFRQNLRFREDTFDLLHNVNLAIPTVKEYILSASIVVARSLMDMQMERAIALEEELLEVLETGHPGPSSFEDEYYQLPYADKAKFLEASEPRMKQFVDLVSQEGKLTTPAPHVMIEAAALHQMRLATLATSSIFGIEKELVREVLVSVKTFQTVLNQAGFNLILEYVANMLESESLPHEAFNTLRRTFFRINFDLKISKISQERLVNYLEEAAEHTASWSTRLPQSVINILLSLTRALTETNLILKAMGVIERYAKPMPSDAARAALGHLGRALPQDVRLYPPADLFSSHVYADSKPNQSPNRSRANTVSTLTSLSRRGQTPIHNTSVASPVASSSEVK